MGDRRVVYRVLVGKPELSTGFWLGNLRERNHFEDADVDGMIILKWIFRKWDVDWVDLAQNRTSCGLL
jgi:hypothetical protein